MITLMHDAEYTRWDYVMRLYYLTDLHVGAKACDERALKRDIASIADDPDARWIGGGDYVDAIGHVGDKRYDPETLAPWALGCADLMGVQRDYVVDLLAPIADKCLGMGDGNHEWMAKKRYGRNLYWEIVSRIADRAGTEPETIGYGAAGFVVLKFRYRAKNSVGSGWPMTIFCHHGYGGGRLPGGHALTMGRALGDYDSDLVLMGHRHVAQVQNKVVVRAARKQRGTPRVSRRVVLFVPSYLSYVPQSKNGSPVDSYAEHKGLPLQDIGTIPIHIRPAKRKITLLFSNHLALETKQDVEEKA